MKGIYALVILVSEHIALAVGALGEVKFDNGLYVYVGSAQTNLEERIARHLRKTKRKFWHIDYLLDAEGVNVVKVLYKEAAKAEECRVAVELGKVGLAIEGFGSSDCHCKSHLFRLPNYEFLKGYMNELSLELRQQSS